MSDYWEDNGIEKPKQVIVCAACRHKETIICGARHFDKAMRSQLILSPIAGGLFEQGFIDQFGDFLTREEAYDIALKNGQEIDIKRNGGHGALFSEGLY